MRVCVFAPPGMLRLLLNSSTQHHIYMCSNLCWHFCREFAQIGLEFFCQKFTDTIYFIAYFIIKKLDSFL
jgi:hypothetical protein